jgi:hypothetical protein
MVSWDAWSLRLRNSSLRHGVGKSLSSSTPLALPCQLKSLNALSKASLYPMMIGCAEGLEPVINCAPISPMESMGIISENEQIQGRAEAVRTLELS